MITAEKQLNYLWYIIQFYKPQKASPPPFLGYKSKCWNMKLDFYYRILYKIYFNVIIFLVILKVINPLEDCGTQ